MRRPRMFSLLPTTFRHVSDTPISLFGKHRQSLELGDRFESENFPGHFVNSFSKLTASSEIAIPHSRQNGLGLFRATCFGEPLLSFPNVGCGTLSAVIRPSLGPSQPSSGYGMKSTPHLLSPTPACLSQPFFLSTSVFPRLCQAHPGIVPI